MSRPVKQPRPWPTTWDQNTLAARGWADRPFEPYRLFAAGSIFAAVIAASAFIGVIRTITRGWPETFTTDQEAKTP